MNAPFNPESFDVPADDCLLCGTLEVPADARNIIIFAHGLTSDSLSPRDRLVARALFNRGFAVLLPDLTISASEHGARCPDDPERILQTAMRLVACIDWLTASAATNGLRIGLFGAGSGAAAAMIAAARRPDDVHAVVSLGGRPDLAEHLLGEVQAPTLMLAGSKDQAGLGHNRSAGAKMRRKPMLELIHGATHLFREPGKLEQVASICFLWFKATLPHCA